MKNVKTVMVVIAEVKELMKQAGYTERTIKLYNSCWNAFLEFIDENCQFSSEIALDFLETKYGITVFTDLCDWYNKREKFWQTKTENIFQLNTIIPYLLIKLNISFIRGGIQLEGMEYVC